MEIKVLFTQKKVTVNLVTPTNGTIVVTYGAENTPVTNGMKLPYNTEVKITATPNKGYEFTKFDVDGKEETTNPLTVNLTENATIGADFVAA